MCHKDRIRFFGDPGQSEDFSGVLDGVAFGTAGDGRKIAILPDIYGLTDFYKGYASYVAGFSAQVFLANPWSQFGELAEPTRDAAYERRHKLKDNEYCDQLKLFLASEAIDAIVGFCIGGNFAFEMARRGYEGTIIAVYPLPWGMSNQDEIAPAFDFMPALSKDVTILMGAADHLAGPENIEKMKSIVAGNAQLTMHLYDESNHGFFTDIDGTDEKLVDNARDAIDRVTKILF